MSAQSETVRRISVVDIAKLHADGVRIATVTAYDYPTAHPGRGGHPADPGRRLAGSGDAGLRHDRPGADDGRDAPSHKGRRPGSHRALIVADMPFLSYATLEDALENAGRFLRDAGAQSVKVEGGVRSARTIETLVRAGIPVMGHIGLTPQAINTLGRVRVQGKSREQARALLADALAVQEAGAFAIVLELLPGQLAEAVTERLHIPTIGIGVWRRVLRPDPGRDRPPRAGLLVSRATPAGLRGPPRRHPRGAARLSGGHRGGRVPGRAQSCRWTMRCSTRCSAGRPTTGRATSPARASRSTADL